MLQYACLLVLHHAVLLFWLQGLGMLSQQLQTLQP
jgi:hypothetical protein